MKNLIAELLLKIAEKEAETEALQARVQALEIMLASLLKNTNAMVRHSVIDDIEHCHFSTTYSPDNTDGKREMLHIYLNKLLNQLQ